jgi:predicted transcriptional regulator
MAINTIKDKVLEAVEKLPSDATIEDAMERLFFLAKVERGMEDAEAGKTISHEEAKRRLTT